MCKNKSLNSKNEVNLGTLTNGEIDANIKNVLFWENYDCRLNLNLIGETYDGLLHEGSRRINFVYPDTFIS